MSEASPPKVDPRIGMVLQDRYRIVKKIGDGGMGAVYEGEHLMIKRRVAIKVLHPQYAQNEEIRKRFQREAQAATAIGHPNIVEVTDMGKLPDGSAYMVLEFLAGRDWAADISKQGAQPLGKVAHILTQVCEALTAAHGKGIVHRDLKPENVFLIERGGDPDFAKVVDFGISKIAGPEGAEHSLTQTGTALGTPYYMSPEQCQGKKDIDQRADIYSMGVMLFQALTAQYPFDDESYPMLVLKICTQSPPLISDYRHDVPPEMQNILHRMLAKDREHRYSSAAEVKAALAPYLGRTDAPMVAQNAPRTSHTGVQALEQAAAGRSATPTGTERLPSAPQMAIPASTTPYPMQAHPPTASGGGKGPILAVAGVFAMLVIGGVIVGAAVALSSGGGGGTEDTGPTASGPPETVEETADDTPAAGEETQPPANVQPPPEEDGAGDDEMVEFEVLLPEDADGVVLFVDNEPSGRRFSAMVARGEPLLVEARGTGYEDFSHTFRPRRDESRTLALTRERTASRRRSSGTDSAPVEAPAETDEPPAAPPTRRARRTTTQSPIRPESWGGSGTNGTRDRRGTSRSGRSTGDTRAGSRVVFGEERGGGSGGGSTVDADNVFGGNR